MEYKVLQANSLITAEQLDELYNLGGWRLVTIIPSGILFYFYFERTL